MQNTSKYVAVQSRMFRACTAITPRPLILLPCAPANGKNAEGANAQTNKPTSGDTGNFQLLVLLLWDAREKCTERGSVGGERLLAPSLPQFSPCRLVGKCVIEPGWNLLHPFFP